VDAARGAGADGAGAPPGTPLPTPPVSTPAPGRADGGGGPGGDAAAPGAPARPAGGVGLWERFEASVANPRAYRDPFREVTLRVRWTRPDGSALDLPGFHDGGSTWKIRALCDRVGAWQYAATFSDGAPGATGSFTCGPSAVPGVIGKDEANPAWFGFRGGKHVVVRSFHVGDRFFAANFPAASRKAFLDWARAQGYNMLSIASHYLNRAAAGRGAGWNTPDLWDDQGKTLKPAAYRDMEALLDDLAARGVLVYPFAGFFGQSSDFPTARADQELFVRYTLARLGSYWNVLLNVAGPEPLVKPDQFRNAMSAAEIRRLGAFIKETDALGHLVSIHNGVGDDPFRGDAWSGYVTLQGAKDKDHRAIAAFIVKNHTGQKPVYAQEVFWPGNLYHGDLSIDDIRKKAFVLLFSAAAINFADMDGDSSSGFSGSLDLQHRKQPVHDAVKKVWDWFAASVEHWRFRPRPDLAEGNACLAEEGREYLVYLPARRPVNVTVAPGPYKVTWIPGANPADRREAGTTADGRALAPPAEGDDWVLQLRR
jgi:hypothetical protein